MANQLFFVCLYEGIDEEVLEFQDKINQAKLANYIRFIPINSYDAKRYLLYNTNKVHISKLPIVIKHSTGEHAKAYHLDEEKVMEELEELKRLYPHRS